MRNKIAFWESSQVVKTGKYTLRASQISYRRKQFSGLRMCVWNIKCKQMVCLLTCWWHSEVYKNTKIYKSWFQVLKTQRSSCSSFKSIHRPAFKNDSFTLGSFLCAAYELCMQPITIHPRITSKIALKSSIRVRLANVFTWLVTYRGISCKMTNQSFSNFKIDIMYTNWPSFNKDVSSHVSNDKGINNQASLYFQTNLWQLTYIYNSF